jgi:FlaA1/EpsC-like NDP-sugar epimerase
MTTPPMKTGEKIMMKPLEGKRVVVTGGTGSLGQVLTKRLLSGEMGVPETLTVFSRDEAKQHFMRIEYQSRVAATDEIIYRNFQKVLQFFIGDVRDFHSLSGVLRNADVVINAAALKQVPTCEYFPWEAVQTNIGGAENIVRAILEHDLPIDTVVGVSTDKACKPVNVMGMTKAIQERVFVQANIRCPSTRFLCVRYGNVLASRGSVIPLFHEQIKAGGPVTVTTPEMTRFLLSLDDAVDTIFAAIRMGTRGQTFIPRAPTARMMDVAKALIGDRRVEITVSGIRPGEKIHEILIGDEEALRTVAIDRWYAIECMLPEVGDSGQTRRVGLSKEYSSGDDVMTLEETTALLASKGLLEIASGPARELLR